jgi:hypothetical protein
MRSWVPEGKKWRAELAGGLGSPTHREDRENEAGASD